MSSKNKLYNEGYNYFLISEVKLTEAEVKEKHPLWRAGYKTAEKEANLQKAIIPLVLHKVERRTFKFQPTIDDIKSVLCRPRFKKLHTVKELEPLYNYIVKTVEKDKDQCKSYNDLKELVHSCFDDIINLGFSTGILNEDDLKQYKR